MFIIFSFFILKLLMFLRKKYNVKVVITLLMDIEIIKLLYEIILTNVSEKINTSLRILDIIVIINSFLFSPKACKVDIRIGST